MEIEERDLWKLVEIDCLKTIKNQKYETGRHGNL